MTNEGLDLQLEDFRKMCGIDRDVLIYKNLIKIRGSLVDYKFHRKIQYVWLFLLSVALGLKKYLGL